MPDARQRGAASSRNKGATISRNWGATSFRNQGADYLGICTPGSVIPENAGKPFSLGDPTIAKELLSAAGFTSIDFIEVKEPVFYGANVDAALNALADLYMIKDALMHTDEAPDRPLQRLRDLLKTHMTSEGVLFDSRAWIITAERVR